MATYSTPAKGFVFKQVIDITNVTTSGSIAIIYDGPAYDVVWLMVQGTVTGNAVDFFILNDTLQAFIPMTVVYNVIGPTKIAHLVLGVPENVSLLKGSHSAQVAIGRHYGGLDGTFNGTVTLYGMRRT